MEINRENIAMGLVGAGAAVCAIPALGFAPAVGVGIITYGGMNVIGQIFDRGARVADRSIQRVIRVFDERIAQPLAAGGAVVAYAYYDKILLDLGNREFLEARDCVGLVECSTKLYSATLLVVTATNMLVLTSVTIYFSIFTRAIQMTFRQIQRPGQLHLQ